MNLQYAADHTFACNDSLMFGGAKVSTHTKSTTVNPVQDAKMSIRSITGKVLMLSVEAVNQPIAPGLPIQGSRPKPNKFSFTILT